MCAAREGFTEIHPAYHRCLAAICRAIQILEDFVPDFYQDMVSRRASSSPVLSFLPVVLVSASVKLARKLSRILLQRVVMLIGLRSFIPMGVGTFGMGTTVSVFQISGQYLLAKQWL